MKNINIDRIKRILKKGKMTLIPISLASTILLTGCTTVERTKEDFLKSAQDSGMTLVEMDKSLYSNYDDLYIVEESTGYSNSCTVEEFGNYTNESNITWSDIRATIANNSNIDDNIKEILYKGISNLENANLQICLEVLNYNLKNLRFEYVTDNDSDIEHDGIFDAINKVAYINTNILGTDMLEKIIMHEILGHGMTLGYIEDKELLCGPQFNLIYTNNNNFNRSKYYTIGEFIKEAQAEMITVMASNEKTVSTNNEHYCIFIQEYQMLLSSLDISFSDAVNKGTMYLINRMKQKGCSDPINYMIYFDTKKQLFESNKNFCNGDCLLDDIEVEYWSEIANEMQQKGYDAQSIESKVNSSFESSKRYIETEYYYGAECIGWSNNIAEEYISFDYIKGYFASDKEKVYTLN